jgi:hypothetical protein
MNFGSPGAVNKVGRDKVANEYDYPIRSSSLLAGTRAWWCRQASGPDHPSALRIVDIAGILAFSPAESEHRTPPTR